MLLDSFPFDHQDLTVRFSSKWTYKQLAFVLDTAWMAEAINCREKTTSPPFASRTLVGSPNSSRSSNDDLDDDDGISSHNNNNNNSNSNSNYKPHPQNEGFISHCDVQPHQWRDQEFRNMGTRGHVLDAEQLGMHFYPVVDINTQVFRHSNFYLYNLIIPIIFISLLTSTSFQFETTQINERLTINITLVLTTIAFQGNVMDRLPTMAKRTLMDRFIFQAFLLLTLVTTANAWAVFEYHETITSVDYWVQNLFWLAFVFLILQMVAGFVREEFERHRHFSAVTDAPGQEGLCFDCKHRSCKRLRKQKFNHDTMLRYNIATFYFGYFDPVAMCYVCLVLFAVAHFSLRSSFWMIQLICGYAGLAAAVVILFLNIVSHLSNKTAHDDRFSSRVMVAGWYRPRTGEHQQPDCDTPLPERFPRCAVVCFFFSIAD